MGLDSFRGLVDPRNLCRRQLNMPESVPMGIRLQRLKHISQGGKTWLNRRIQTVMFMSLCQGLPLFPNHVVPKNLGMSCFSQCVHKTGCPNNKTRDSKRQLKYRMSKPKTYVFVHSKLIVIVEGICSICTEKKPHNSAELRS